jgi:hypothetical protein
VYLVFQRRQLHEYYEARAMSLKNYNVSDWILKTWYD